MNIQLSDHFGYKKLLKYTLPSCAMLIFTSIYGVVDGFFVSNYVGETAFAAVNFIMPFLMLGDSLGFMLSAGGAAIVSLLIGKGEKKRANEIFSMIVYSGIILGIIIYIATVSLMKPVAVALGAEGELLEYSLEYGKIIMVTAPCFVLQYVFQSFFSVAEKPQLGFTFTAVAGVSNMILDWLFMAVFQWGVTGAAIASCIGQAIGGFGPVVYFALPNKSLLRLCKTKFYANEFIASCKDGVASFVSNISMSLVNMVYNTRLLAIAGEYGVSAYGIIMYVCFIFFGLLSGYSMGIAPVIGYNYGAENFEELEGVTKKSLNIIADASILCVVLSLVFARPLATVFAGYDEEFLAISVRALRLYMINYIFAGFNIFGTSFFTALNDGKVAAIISTLRTLLFQLPAIYIMSYFFGIDGIWLALTVAEGLCLIVTAVFYFKNKSKYKY